MAALVAIPVGVSAVAYGPLHGVNKTLHRYLVSADDGGPVTLVSLTGLPYWLLAALIAGGCVIGNILSGFALMSVGNLVFGVTVLLANWGTTLLYLRGLE